MKWMDKYEVLKVFHAKHGHCKIIKTLKLDTTKGIGRWINRQKQYANDNNLSEKRRTLLDEIGFFDEENQRSQPGVQSLSVAGANWMSWFEELKEFHSINGHCKVPWNENIQLHGWRWRQLQNWKNNKLSEDHSNLLNNIGFFEQEELTGPQPSRSLMNEDAKWMTSFEKLRTYHATHGHFRMPQAESMALYSWRRRQFQYSKSGALSQEKHALLKNIGFFDQDSSPRLTRKSLNLIDETPSSSNSLIQRVNHLNDIVGIALETDINLCEKVEMLEVKIFGKTKEGTIMRRIEVLESELR